MRINKLTKARFCSTRFASRANFEPSPPAPFPMFTEEQFKRSRSALLAQRVPRGCVLLETLFLGPDDGWEELPGHIQRHKMVAKLDCDAFVGIRFEADPSDKFVVAASAKTIDRRYGPSFGARWNWAAVNLRTGEGLTSRRSLAKGTGHVREFRL
mgnify:CR=1 FL=1